MPLDPDLKSPVEQGVADIDHRGRIRVPSRMARLLSWLPSSGAPVDALAVFDEPGHIILLSWKERSPPVLTRRKKLIQDAQESPEALEGLRLLEDRYKRIPIPRDLRPTLSIEALMHLELPVATTTHVYIVRVFDALEILSPMFRKQRNTDHDALTGLP